MDLRGAFGGIVEDNKDPEKLGRLKVRVPHVYGAVGGVFGAVTTDDLPWALPTGLPNGLTQQSGGADWLPEIGDQVLVLFLDNEPEKPVWQWFMQTQQAVDDFPLHTYEANKDGSVGKPKRGAWVRYGHTAEWNTDGLIFTTSKGYRLLLTDASSAGNDGDISLATQAGQFFEFDDSTGDSTLNVNNDWNINVGSQILAIADSFSLTTLTDEIEMISGTDTTIETTQDFDVTVGQNWQMTVTGTSIFDLTGDWTVNATQNIVLDAGANLTLNAGSQLILDVTGAVTLATTGAVNITSDLEVALDFLKLSLGEGAISPFVLGDQLFAYLEALYNVLLTHTHSGVFPGGASTSPMVPGPPPPVPTMLSQFIFGR
jgi:phage baseplate assembly protein gpV